jgi:hypothetical protein
MDVVTVLGAIVATFAASYVVLRSAGLINRALGRSTMSVLQRVRGLVLAAMSIQFIFEVEFSCSRRSGRDAAVMPGHDPRLLPGGHDAFEQRSKCQDINGGRWVLLVVNDEWHDERRVVLW